MTVPQPYAMSATIPTTYPAPPPLPEAQVKANIKCMNAAAHPKGHFPTATYSCLACQAYLCKSCNTSKHSADKHAVVPISTLKSYIVFNPSKRPGESNVYRNIKQPDVKKVDWRVKGNGTLYETFQAALQRDPNARMLGQRTVDPLTGEAGAYAWQTYDEVADRVKRVGNGLRQLQANKRDKIGLYSINRPEWIIGEYACYSQGLTPVPLYDTLGPEAAQHVIQQAGVKVVIASEDKVANLIQVAEHVPGLEQIIVMPRQPFEPELTVPIAYDTKYSNATIHRLADVELLGMRHYYDDQPPAPEDLMTISYTSGTTGLPKGAMITHGNMVSNMSATEHHIDDSIQFVPGDCHISYLPLAHMYERLTASNMISNGGSIGFFRGDPLKLLDDMAELKPTGFPIVPRLANRVLDAISQQVDEIGGVKAKLFWRALEAKKHNWQTKKQLTHAFYDRIVFRKVRERLGGRVRLMVTGSAPISDEAKNFMRLVFSAPVWEGYGQTEATAGISIDADGEGHVGTPLPCNEVKLVDVPEMKYLTSDKTNGQYTPRGELCARGWNKFNGYYNDKEKTDEAVDAEGWLHTGDVAMILPSGQIRIIDRKKNIFKLSQGEYIAPEKIENVYVRSKYIAQAFVYGDSLQSNLVAVIVPDEAVIMDYAKKNMGFSGTFEQLCKSSEVKTFIMADMKHVGADAKLQSFEHVRDVHLHHVLFAPPILTPTMKLVRNKAKEVFQTQIDDMYRQITSSSKLLRSSL